MNKASGILLYIRGQKTAPFRVRMNNGRSVFHLGKLQTLARGASLTAFFLLQIPSIALGDELSELKEQVQHIQEENRLHKEEMNRQNELIGRLLEKIEALESNNEILSKELHGLKGKPEAEAVEEKIGLPKKPELPKVNINGFSDFGFGLTLADEKKDNTFLLGSFDLFFKSTLSERLSFLAETNFFFRSSTNESDFELERIELKYSLSDLLNVKMGRMHTPLGYWNQAFHHGTWLQTTISRPEVYRFEGQGGPLPIHSVGVEAFGLFPLPLFDLEYNFDVLNGRGATITSVQNARDANDSKAVNALISVKPNFTEALKAGVDIYYDTIPPNPGVGARAKRINELILGGYFIFHNKNLELLGELFNIHHDDRTLAKNFDTLGSYIQGSYKIDKFTPYYRFDLVDFAGGDPFYAGIDNDIKKHTAGIRWDIFEWNALKFEYGYSDRDEAAIEHSFTVNSSYAF